LLEKICSYGFTLFSSFLTDRSIYVVVDDVTFTSLPIYSGIPQGSVLSPTSLLLFINDFRHSISYHVHSFADDSTLDNCFPFSSQPSSIARSESRIALSSAVDADLCSISSWGSSRNLVKFNVSKIKFLPISFYTTPSNYDTVLENNILPPLNSVNILGINITSNFSWRQHISEVANSASKTLGVLFRCGKYISSEQLF